ncbi:hypothetical protein R1sor_019592 [Riccia sorocarpa]|uniref:Transmembrane protein 69 n=1 Tax=Riccia sorocarpa TaxID=122646 RepID=A0ABD3IGR7_9MARC
MLRGASGNAARALRLTFVRRLAILRQGDIALHDSPGPSQASHSAAELAASDYRESGAMIGPHEGNAAWTQFYNSHAFQSLPYSSNTRSSGASGEAFKGSFFLPGITPVSSRSLSGPYCMDRQASLLNSVKLHESTLVLAELVQRNSYHVQRRSLASASTDGKKPLESDVSKAKASEEKAVKEEDTQSFGKRFGSRVRHLLSDLENVPVPALGLGLAGAIPFVALTPGIASVLPLPESLYAVHMDAQAAYGAVILAFLGGPYWGLAMADNGGGSSKSVFSRISVQTLRYAWSVIPSLVAWSALLLPLASKYAVLITSFGLVLGVDALFTRMGLLPSWFMPLRILLTSIAVLSMTSSLIVTSAMNAAAAITH